MPRKKNEAAAELARLRAKKLGPDRVREIATFASHARSTSMTPEQRQDVARAAAIARWGAKKKPDKGDDKPGLTGAGVRNPTGKGPKKGAAAVRVRRKVKE